MKRQRSLQTILIISISMLVLSILLSFLKKLDFLKTLFLLQIWGFGMGLVIEKLVLKPMYNIIYINSKNAKFDQMTGICSRNEFIRRKKQYNHSESMGVIFFDLNNLKKTNDRYGHYAGDELIIATAEVFIDFRSKLGKQQMDYYRMGGDEFLVVLPNINSEENLIDVQKQIIEAMSKKKILKFEKIQISLSCGNAYSDEKIDVDILANIADQRMFENKKTSKAIR